MNPDQEEAVPLDDFVEYVDEISIPRQPVTKMGQKLKMHLRRQKYREGSIESAVEKVFKEAEQLESATHTESID